jgi:WD40 repeat protein
MKKIGIIRIESGNFAEGFKLNMRLQLSGAEVSGILPENHKILPLYARWNNKYREYGKILRKSNHLEINNDDIDYKPSPTEITNIEGKETCYQHLVALQFDLHHEMKSWLENISNDIRDSLVGDIGGWENEYALIIEVFSLDIGKEIYQLPWHNWSLLEKHKKLEVSFAIGSDGKTFDQSLQSNKIQPLVEILAIIGSNKGDDILDTSMDIALLKSNDDLRLEILEDPHKDKLLNTLKSDYSWNILFYAGHSSTQQSGVITINDNDVSINELQEGLKIAAKNGLKLAIFNSCDGIGLAKGVLDSGIPFTIVMRDAIPDVCAKYFLEQFISEYIKQGLSLHTAVRLARTQLGLKYEKDYPGVANLPIIMQYPETAPPVWHELRGIESPYKGLQPYTENDNAFFIGREKALEKFRKLISENSVMFVTGEAGSGKTSLVKIGLIPVLKHEEKWEVIEYSILLNSSLDNIYSDLDSIVQRKSNSSAIIIIDRYERIMHFDSVDQINFVEKISNCSHIKLKFIFMSNKGVFYDHKKSLIISELEYIQQVKDSLVDIITKPAKFFEVDFEEGLSQILINDMTASYTNLPFLQLLLKELWNHKKLNQIITHKSYRAIGGAGGVIGQYAEHWHKKLSESSTKNFIENIQIILTKLVQIDDSSNYINESMHQDIFLISSIKTRQEFDLLIERMETDRIIRSVFEDNRKYFQIYHPALVSEWLIHQNWFREYNNQLVDVHWIEEKYNQWNLVGENKKSLLLRREDLSKALEIQDNLKKFLSKKAICFIEISDRESKSQKKKIKLGFILAFASFASLSSISPHFYYSNIVLPRLFKNSESLRKNDAMAGLLSAISIFLQDKSFESQLLLWKSLHESHEKQQFNTTNNIFISPKFSSSKDNKFLVIDGDSVLIKSANGLSNTVLIKGEQHNIRFADFSPSHPHYLVTTSYDKSAVVWNTNSKKVIYKLSTENHINYSSFNPENPNQLLTVGGNGEAILWAFDKPIYLQGHKKEISMGVFSTKNSKRILTVGKDSIANIWDSNTPSKPIHSLVHNDLPISSGDFSPHDENIISTIVDREIHIWRTGKSQSHQILKGHNGKIIQTLFNPVNPNQIVSLTKNGECFVWDIRSGLSTPIGIKNIHGVAYYPKSGLLLTVGSDQLARVWKITTQANEIEQYPLRPTNSLKYLTFDPKNPDQFLTTMNNSNTVRLWNLKAQDEIELSLDKYSLENKVIPAITASFNPGMNQVITINRDSTLNIWETQKTRKNNNHPSKIIPMPKKINVVEKAWFSKFFPQQVVILNDKGVLYLWNYNNNELLEMKQEMGEAVQEIRFSNDFSNKILVISDYKVSIWNPLKGSIDIAPSREYKYKIVNAEFIPEPESSSSSVIMIDRTGRIYTWNTNTSEQKYMYSKPLNALTDFKFMPKYFSKKIFGQSDDENIELIDIGLSESILVKAPLDEIRSYTNVIYSDKKSFLISDKNGKIEVFDIASPYEKLVMKSGEEKNTFIELSPDKLTQSIVIDSAGRTSLYNIGGEDLLKIAFNNMSRCLSRQEINEFWTNKKLLEQYYTKFRLPKTTNEYNQLRCQ